MCRSVLFHPYGCKSSVMKKVFFMMGWAFLFSVQTALAGNLTILTENLPPLNYLKDGVLVGPSVDIVREIQRRVGSHEQIEVYPWSRAYKTALEKENVVLFSTTYTEDRHDNFKWIGPVGKKRDILVAKRGSGIKIKSLKDAMNVRCIGTVRDDTKESLLKRLGFTNLEPVSDERQNAKNLVLGRIDLWVYKKPGLRTVCELAEVNYDEVEEVFYLREVELMIAFSNKTPDGMVQSWRNAFNEMLTDGTIMTIKKKWNAELEDRPFPEILGKRSQ